MMQMPMCYVCKRLKDFCFDGQGKIIAHCKAYPDGIPEAVLYSGHFYPKPGDNDLQFDGEVLDFSKKSKEEEDEDYERNKKYYEGLDMPDADWLKMKRKENKILEKIDDEDILRFRQRREDLFF